MPSLFYTKNKKNNQPESPGQYNSIRIVKERTHRNTSFFVGGGEPALTHWSFLMDPMSPVHFLTH